MTKKKPIEKLAAALKVPVSYLDKGPFDLEPVAAAMFPESPDLLDQHDAAVEAVDAPVLPSMTHEELFERAKIKGHVRWNFTGTIEKIFLTKDGKAVLALGRFTKFHFIVRKAKPDRSFRCQPCEPTIATKEEQRESARKTKWFVDPDAPRDPNKPKKKWKKPKGEKIVAHLDDANLVPVETKP